MPVWPIGYSVARGLAAYCSFRHHAGRVMRKFLLATAALIAFAGPAIAADMRAPVYKAPPPVVPAWSWTGCFVGGHAGSLWTKQDWTNLTPGGDFFGAWLGRHQANSWLGGVQAGCDYQFAGGFVIGIQGDYAWTDAAGSHDSAREIGVAYHSKAKSLASLTGRAGYAWDRFLGYVRGGGAWQRNDYSASTIILGTVYAGTETRSGWTVGVGGEYAFTNVLSGFVEYSYYDYGTGRVPLTPLLAGLRPGLVDVKESTSVVRAGLNIRFGGLRGY
jgi:outer membrane immunogenic protein